MHWSLSVWAVFLLSGLQNASAVEEGWESVACGLYTPAEDVTLLSGDLGKWLLEDTVSEFPEDCGPTTNTGEILCTGNGKSLRLTSNNSNSSCADNIWVALFTDLPQIGNNIHIPIEEDTILTFREEGELTGSSRAPSGWPAHYDMVYLEIEDHLGNVIAYVLQRPENAEPDDSENHRREVFLDPGAGTYARNLYEDFQKVPLFNTGASHRVWKIAFEIDEHAWAVLDDLTIAPGSLPPTPSATRTRTQTPSRTATPTVTPTCDCLPDCADARINVECLTPGSPAHQNARCVGILTEQGASAGISGTVFVVSAKQNAALVITANHILSRPATDYRVDFDVECDTCECGQQKPPQGGRVLGLVHRNADLDYALLEIPAGIAANRGTARLDRRSPVLNALVYSIDHSGGAMKGYGIGHVTEVSVPSQGGTTRTRLSVHVSNGSSGGPVYSADRHCVTAMIAGGNGGACSGDTWSIPMTEIVRDAAAPAMGTGYRLSFRNLADADLDGRVGFRDLLPWVEAWGLGESFPDIAPLPDTDGTVDENDLLEWVRQQQSHARGTPDESR